MAVSGIRFGNTSASSFQDILRAPQAYRQQTQPTAATNISLGQEKKKSKVVPILLGAAVVAGALGIASSKGAFTTSKFATEAKNSIVKGILSGCEFVGKGVRKLAAPIINIFKSGKTEAGPNIKTLPGFRGVRKKMPRPNIPQ